MPHWERYSQIEIQWTPTRTLVIRDHHSLNDLRTTLSNEEFAELIIHLYRWFPFYTINYLEQGHFACIRLSVLSTYYSRFVPSPH